MRRRFETRRTAAPAARTVSIFNTRVTKWIERGEEERRKEEEEDWGWEGYKYSARLGGAFPFRSRLFFSNRSANAHNRTGSSSGDMSRIDIDTCYQSVSFEDAYREQ